MTGRRPGLAADERGLALERAAIWLLVIAVIASVAGSVAYFAEDVRTDVPDAEFDVAFDEETRTVTVTHAGGDPIRDRSAKRLSVAVEDADSGAFTRVTWAGDNVSFSDRGHGYPVTEGDQFAVDDPTVDADGDGNYHDADETVGIELDQGDTVSVVWRGTRRSGNVATVELANATLGESE